jgi:hypothetical protein
MTEQGEKFPTGSLVYVQLKGCFYGAMIIGKGKN